MRLLLINQFFWPDLAATAQLLWDLAESAVEAGFEVTALSGRASYLRGMSPRLRSREERGGVQIRRVWCTNFGRRRTVGRMLDYASYFLMALPRVLLGSRQDVVVCLSTPPMVAVLGAIARRRGSRFVYKVEDLYPDIAVALGTLRKASPTTRALEGLSRHLLRQADACVALDEAMSKELATRGAKRVEVIPNWANGEAIRPDSQAGEHFRQEEDLGKDLLVLYSGNLGRAHRFDAVVQAASVLASQRPGAQFLFVGGGPRLAEVRAGTAGLRNVRFLPYQPQERLHELYNAADIHLITLRDEAAGLLVPSKYAAALSAGKPVLVAGGRGSDLYEEVVREGVGWACAHSPEEVLSVLRDVVKVPAKLGEMGHNARELFDRKYSRKIATARWLGLLRSLSAGVGQRNMPDASRSGEESLVMKGRRMR